MSNRVSEKTIRNLFGYLCNAVGKQVATTYGQKGAWALDHQACYGGWKIVEYMPSGGEGEPFGSTRYSAAEMEMVIRFALRAVAIDRDENSGSYWPTDKVTNASN